LNATEGTPQGLPFFYWLNGSRAETTHEQDGRNDLIKLRG
jgi:hypothetical protein